MFSKILKNLFDQNYDITEQEFQKDIQILNLNDEIPEFNFQTFLNKINQISKIDDGFIILESLDFMILQLFNNNNEYYFEMLTFIIDRLKNLKEDS